jgi:pimeloyl-ACP methyl ester carboxylesterase
MAGRPWRPAAPPDIESAAHRMVTIQTHDSGPLDVHYHEAGDGPPILMLHGWPQHAWCWRYVVPLLSDRYRLICPDLRGFGWTGAPGRGYNGLSFGADAIALLDALEIERTFLVGHDWGGFAAFAAGIAAPQRIERMLVLNTLPPWVQLSPRQALELWRFIYVFVLAAGGERLIGSRPEIVARMLSADAVGDNISWEDALAYGRQLQRPESAAATQQLYASYVRSIREVGMRGRFDDLRLTVPTRFLMGAQDKAISPLMLAGIEDHCDDIAVELVEDSGHFIAEEKPELVAERAAEFFGAGLGVAAASSAG